MTRMKRLLTPEKIGADAEMPYSDPELGVVGGELWSDEAWENTLELQ